MKIKRLLLLLALPLLVASCTSYKNVPYLQNPEAVNDFEETLPLYDAKIMPKDLLSITVNTTDPKAATPFNLTVQTPINAALTNISTTTQPTMQQYLVNNKGEIDFPVIGRLEVGGLTKNEAEDLAMAGDMTIYGVRDNVKLIREDVNGKREIINLNLNNAEVVTSPYYYLKQNDIIYVTPNKTKAKNSDIGNSTTLWVSSLSILVSIAGLLVNILK